MIRQQGGFDATRALEQDSSFAEHTIRRLLITDDLLYSEGLRFGKPITEKTPEGCSTGFGLRRPSQRLCRGGCAHRAGPPFIVLMTGEISRERSAVDRVE